TRTAWLLSEPRDIGLAPRAAHITRSTLISPRHRSTQRCACTVTLEAERAMRESNTTARAPAPGRTKITILANGNHGHHLLPPISLARSHSQSRPARIKLPGCMRAWTIGVNKEQRVNFITTGKAQVRSVKCCVLFDPKDGAILHMHRVVTMEGA